VLRGAGYQVLSDASAFSRDPLVYGAPAVRTLIARPPAGGVSAVTLRETQPWKGGADDSTFSVALALRGPERGGLSRADRRRLGLQP
jgi:hypothetical protein